MTQQSLLVFPLDEEQQRYIEFWLSLLRKGEVHCFATYRTEKDTDRTVQGTYMGLEKGKIVLRYNERNNRVPVDRCHRMTYDKAAQGEDFDKTQVDKMWHERIY